MTHHELALRQTLRRDGAEDPGFVAALLGYLRALTQQLPVLRGAQLGRDQLGERGADMSAQRVTVPSANGHIN